MSFNFDDLKYRRLAVATEYLKPAGDPVEDCVGPRLDAVLELWNERAAIQGTDNAELIQWHRDNGKTDAELRRACELCAAADLALSYGARVLAIIRPELTAD